MLNLRIYSLDVWVSIHAIGTVASPCKCGLDALAEGPSHRRGKRHGHEGLISDVGQCWVII